MKCNQNKDLACLPSSYFLSPIGIVPCRSNAFSSPLRCSWILSTFLKEKVAYWLNLLFQGSSYLSPYAYGILHKAHHSYSDTKKIHILQINIKHCSMMLHTANEYGYL